MARSRNIKPGFFQNEELAELQPLERLLFIGLWTLADREGRIEDRPKKIKAQIFPFDEFNVDEGLMAVEEKGFIERYANGNVACISIAKWHKHQNPHHMEAPSELPPPPGQQNRFNHSPIAKAQRTRILARDNYKCVKCGNSASLHIDHMIPISKGGDSEDSNLRILCSFCNTSKGDGIENGSSSTQGRIDQPAPCPTDSLNLIPLSPIPLTDSPFPHPPSKGTHVPRDRPKGKSPPYSSEFEGLWRAYPRKDGSKANAFIAYQRAIKEGTDHGRLITGITEFAGYVTRTGMGQRYIPHASTWLNERRWEAEYTDGRAYLDSKSDRPSEKQRTVAAFADIIAKRNAEADPGLQGQQEPANHPAGASPPAVKGLW